MKICGIDPGKPPKTVFAHNSVFDGPDALTGRWHCSRKPPTFGHFDLVVAEKPAGVIRKNRTPASVVSPAFWGGAALFSVALAPDGLRCWIPVEDWKRKLLGPAWNMKKEAACRDFIKQFGLTGLDPEADSDQDVIDAVAISEAAALFTRKELKKWAVKW